MLPEAITGRPPPHTPTTRPAMTLVPPIILVDCSCGSRWDSSV
uniref:Uncharacterized protein n=1 Tax=Arundo donax TaxID=35708 RepID=A0A0A9DVE0_ARUDO